MRLGGRAFEFLQYCGKPVLLVEIKILDEDKCISLLCSLTNSWDSLVVAIGSNSTSLKFEEVVSYLLSEEMR